MKDEVLKNHAASIRNENDRSLLLQLFPDLIDIQGIPIVAVRSYLHNCPERFFSREVYSLMLDWLKNRDLTHRNQLQQYFVENTTELSMAMHFLRQINAEDWHDEIFDAANENEIFRVIDQKIHPVYLRLVEGVFRPLIKQVAYFYRIEKGKGVDGLDLFQIVAELSSSPMNVCCKGYEHNVRNGIGHGGITFAKNAIRYRDKKGKTKTFDVSSVFRFVDDMIDTCNGLASAIKVFLLQMFSFDYLLPHDFLVEALDRPHFSGHLVTPLFSYNLLG